jgi:hypothetical protein
MNDKEKIAMLISALKQTVDAFNQIPNKGLRGAYKNTYALCCHIEKVIIEADPD